MSIMPAAARTLSHVYPADARLNEAGRLEVGGCDVIDDVGGTLSMTKLRVADHAEGKPKASCAWASQ